MTQAMSDSIHTPLITSCRLASSHYLYQPSVAYFLDGAEISQLFPTPGRTYIARFVKPFMLPFYSP